MEQILHHLAALRDRRAANQRAADNDRDEIYALIRSMPPHTDKTAIHRASGVSRPTVYQLLEQGFSLHTEPELLTNEAAVREYIAQIRAARANPDAQIGLVDVIAAFVVDAKYSIGNRRQDGADWDWPDLEEALGSALIWQRSQDAGDLDELLDELDEAARRVEVDTRDAATGG
ncbi:hypothetical protein [Mycolicibacterium fortuitum]|uniref:Helix-turn-helix domain-containing protein n=2 Tax=Mycolicibacterium fortuitum TaxID=1766 RepID=A0AAE4VG27_MYCFO|nr:hypothetical protein [Mycolicibacterium fortuitum]MCV7137931.1 hypothetical protein [Mycolicibacterium fortuitum]MDV7194498.1 hypothetical protein [Mycolicibacterium fortuitum]MDV7207873.1 hypothetical protein [Mycolicibacterium fortuitum]MDV7229170.1 hypothetical protein [Mycolicibacterium fortuitum]MDV7260870.1 hypothetical protein [Mycolicibacterium fortuitum]